MRARFLTIALALCATAPLTPATASAAPAPAWKLTITPAPANFAPGGKAEFALIATNVGGEETKAPYTLKATLPAPLEPLGATAEDDDPGTSANPACTVEPLSGEASCTGAGPLGSGYEVTAHFRFKVPSGASPETIVLKEASVEGGGAALASQEASAPIQAGPVPFDFLAGDSGFSELFNEQDGNPSTTAGSHPYQLTVDLGFPTEATEIPGIPLTGAGHLRDTIIEMPRGFSGDPAAVPVLCTVAQLTSQESSFPCPDASQVGMAKIVTQFTEGVQVISEPLYAMVPEPGTVAQLGFQVANIGVYVYPSASVRTDGDYGVSVKTDDILALGANPIFDVNVQVWGDPASTLHDKIRGHCASAPGSCPVPEREDAFLTMPGDCPGTPLRFSAKADSWEEAGSFREATYESPAISGCNQLSYEPALSVKPTTSLAGSPTGLNANLHQPQDLQKEHRYTAALKDATVTLPEGLVANPSQADGLAACTQAQIGYLGEGHYSKAPQSCPDASKLGTLEVSSPLLAEYKNGGTEVQTDPETGEPIPRPLKGAVYLAKPFENQFGSLLAIYLAVEDPQSGIVAKLAGKVEPDPNTGRLTTRFTENPELPLEDVKLHFFGGARASLTTPVSCGTHTTTSTLVPWSAPEGQDAHPSSSFQTTAEPGGGSCPGSEGAAANKPAFGAGTIAPQAGAYSPFVLKLSRDDGTQRIAGIDTLLPPGLSGKLAGIGQCSEAQLAQAKAREKPNEGALEKSNPSCPASSEVGTVDVAAGSGPTPFHTQGHAYLAGPYKGAPLSLAVIVPAVAGPFDLGAVLSRVALHVEPETAQIHAVSDPLPQILEGIPLDVRSISLSMGRPQFTLNPTSCDPLQITGSALSALGQSAALSSPFQVGGCPQLPFKPKLSLKLKGGTKRAGHPKLIATLKAKPGEANVASAQVKLPPSAFLDQAHIRTVCTRVQFAANACPAGSIYGKAQARTPLLDYSLAGNVYLRSSNHKLPDLVVALKGPDYQPIEIDLAGKTDSVKGALRNTFEAVPDAPVSTFRLELFGGKRGLVVNSRNLCAHRYRAEVNLTGQNGKVFDTTPAVGGGCKGRRKRHGRRRR